MQQIINHVGGTFALLSISLSLAFGLTLREMVDKLLGDFMSNNTFCWTFYHLMSLSLMYQGMDAIGISVFRFLYIRKGAWVKYTFGEFNLLFLVGIFNVSVTCLIVYLYSIENISSRSIFNMCMGHSQNFEVSKGLHHVIYNQLQGTVLDHEYLT
jgi:hypothetical protein